MSDIKSFLIGSVKINGTAALAPMAGVSDAALRALCKAFGAAYVVGEMASAKGIGMGGKKSAALLAVPEEQRPMAVQLFGATPESMAEAARAAMAYRPDVIDLNMGCPTPKITGQGCGAALMREPLRAEAIVRAVVAAVPLPVTVKIRKGWDEHSVNAVPFAQRMEAAGAAAVTVHGRTRAQMYAPAADWGIIAEVKAALGVPVIGNGDVTDAGGALRMARETGVDLVMVGRGACGRPWIFRQIADAFGGRVPAEPTAAEKMAVMLRHLALMAEEKGEGALAREGRRQAAWYMRGLRGAAALRERCARMATLADAEAIAAACVRLNT